MKKWKNFEKKIGKKGHFLKPGLDNYDSYHNSQNEAKEVERDSTTTERIEFLRHGIHSDRKIRVVYPENF